MRDSVIGVVILVLLVASNALAKNHEDIFVAKSLGFSIQSPVLVPSSSESYQVAIFNLPAEKGFSGNVNVQCQEYAYSLDAYDQLSRDQFAQLGFTIIGREKRKGEYVYEYSGQMQGLELHWYVRAVAAPRYIYLITATALEKSWPKQKNALIKSVESFSRQ